MKIKIFMNSAGHNSERDVLRNMYDGIEEHLVPKDKAEKKRWRQVNKSKGLQGSGVFYDYTEKARGCDLAVMFGSWKPERSRVHHEIRTAIYKSDIPFLCIETPLLGRRVFQPNQHYRVGINGFLNRDAIWGEERDYPADRFNALGLSYSGWKKKRGKKIIIALQLAGDASLRHNDINEWCKNTVQTLRRHTDRPIEIRTHPGVSDKGWSNHEELFRWFLFKNFPNVQFVNGKETPWEDHILDAYCVVAYTSGMSIDAVLNGIPVIAVDEGNFAWNVGERKLSNIENLTLADSKDVQQWLYNLAYCQWTPEEMESGQCWLHLESSIKELIDENRSNLS